MLAVSRRFRGPTPRRRCAPDVKSRRLRRLRVRDAGTSGPPRIDLRTEPTAERLRRRRATPGRVGRTEDRRRHQRAPPARADERFDGTQTLLQGPDPSASRTSTGRSMGGAGRQSRCRRPASSPGSAHPGPAPKRLLCRDDDVGFEALSVLKRHDVGVTDAARAPKRSELPAAPRRAVRGSPDASRDRGLAHGEHPRRSRRRDDASCRSRTMPPKKGWKKRSIIAPLKPYLPVALRARSRRRRPARSLPATRRRRRRSGACGEGAAPSAAGAGSGRRGGDLEGPTHQDRAGLKAAQVERA